MNKKKITSLLVAGAMTIGIVGGTLAWFTSQDDVTNKFSTGTYNDEINHGLDIWEKFDALKAVKLTPGTEVTKKVQVKNEASYSQFIRVKLTPSWTAPDSIKGTDKNLDLNLNEDAIKDEPTEGYWYDDGNYYYYIGVVGSNKFTPLLLNSVTLNKAADNTYVGADFEVRVDADSIQSDNKAYEDWKGISQNVKDALAKCSEDKGQAESSGTEATGAVKVFGN